MGKTDLCLQFIGMNESDDDLLHVVEELKDNKDQIKCVYPSKKACDRNATTNYGFCTRHSLTMKGKNIQKMWETALSEIETDLSDATDDAEEESVEFEDKDDVTEEDKVKEEESSNEKVDAKYVPSDTSDEKSEESPKYNDDGVKTTAPGKYEFPIVKNKYGQNIHRASGLVFNLRTSTAIGKVAPEGKLYALDSDDVAFCKKYNIRHKVLY